MAETGTWWIVERCAGVADPGVVQRVGLESGLDAVARPGYSVVSSVVCSGAGYGAG